MEGSPHTHQLALNRNYQGRWVLTYGDTSVMVFPSGVAEDRMTVDQWHVAMRHARNTIVEQHDQGSKAAAEEAHKVAEAAYQRNEILRMLQPPRPDIWFSEELPKLAPVIEEAEPTTPRAMPQKWSLLGA
jgi:hypothetical protein